MTSPGQGQVYGYAHRGTITGPSELDGYWMVRVTAINPVRPIGPYPSTVPDHTVGDRVLLTQIGTSRDDLVITGKLPPTPWESHLPIGIDDVTGLQGALNDRATDAELAALASSTDSRLDTLEASDTAQGGRLTAVESLNTTQDGRLTAVEGVNTTQNTRLTAVEGVNTTQDGRLTAVEGVNTAQDTELGLLQTYMNAAYDWDIYGDLIAPITRREASNILTTTSSSVYIVKLRTHTAITAGRIRWLLGGAVATGPGTMTGGVYTASAAAGPYTLAKSTTAQAALANGLYNIAWSDASSLAIARGTWVLLALHVSSGYTANPKLATQHNAPSTLATSLGLHPNPPVVNIGIKSGLSALPASISPHDGTWTALNLNFWAALAA